MANQQDLPLVTAYTLVYNTGKLVTRALESLKKQSYPQDKIQSIILDDCSSDDSVAIIEKWISDNNHSCTFIKHEANLGVCKSLNEILRYAKGKYCTGISDDLWKPDRLSYCIEEFEKLSDEYALVYTPIDICNEDDQILYTNVISNYGDQFPDMFTKIITRGLEIPAPSTIYKTAIIKKLHGFDERLSFEDTDLILRLSASYKFCFLNRSLTIYRKNIKSRSSLSDLHTQNHNIVLDFIKMNSNSFGQSLAKDNLLVSTYFDLLEIWYLYRYNKPFSLSKARSNYTIWATVRLKIYREKGQVLKYYFLLIKLIFKFYSPYKIRDILFLSRKYFDKDFQYY